MKMQFHKAVVKVLVIVATDRTKTPVSLIFVDGNTLSTVSAAGREQQQRKSVEQASVIQL